MCVEVSNLVEADILSQSLKHFHTAMITSQQDFQPTTSVLCLEQFKSFCIH